MTKSDDDKKPGSSQDQLRKWIENQVVFRSTNEKIKKNFDALKNIALHEEQREFAYRPNTKLYYVCECSDENCHQRLKLLQSTYDKIHQKRNRFIVVDGHEKVEVEKVVERHPNYSVVEKYVTPPERVPRLHHTSVDNT
jgi:redox-regulated HSP33 family molecular chaperone